MKKRRLFAFLFIFLLMGFLFVSAENSTSPGEITTGTDSDSNDLVDKAYDCLESKIDSKGCQALTTQEKIFSLLALGKCKQELADEAKDNQCWPKSGCDVKTTAQAMLAYEKAGIGTDNIENWLLSQKQTPLELDWFLQIETPEESTCAISYNDHTYHTIVRDNKKLDSGAGSCLTLSSNGYWLKISPTCFENKFTISCNKAFQTNLLYKKKNSKTIYVSENTHSATQDSTTEETVVSYCFGKNTCEYEDSLWTAAVISYKKGLSEVQEFLPYLFTLAEENDEFLPESFLYLMTGYEDFRNDLLLKQKYNKYWDESGDKFYDTALALYPFGAEEPEQKTKAIDWLLDSKTQGADGCWDNGNIINNAFLLNSIWPRLVSVSSEATPDPDCANAGYFCMSAADCSGDLLSGYSCPGMFRCCSTELEQQTCVEQGGEICSSNQICANGGTEISASDTDFSEICCYGGSCQEPIVESACETAGGTCSSFGCSYDEEESSESCGDSSMTCCMQKTSSSSSSWSWFWIFFFLVLIALVALGFFFRNKLKEYWFRFRAGKFRGSASSIKRPPAGGMPPRGSLAMPLIRRTPRRIIPGSMPIRRSVAKRAPIQKKTAMDDVLKKLKEMGR